MTPTGPMASQRATARSPTVEHGSSSASPTTVARSFARAYARLLFFEDGPPHPSARQVEAAARTITTSCAAPSHGQYPCIVHPPNKTPPVQACAALATAAGQVDVDDVRCGDRAAPFPILRPGYVDCARIGHVVTIRGRSRTFTQTASDHRDDSRADLLAVRVASNAHQLCWNFKTAAPPAPEERLYLGAAGATSGLDFASPDGPSAQDGASSIPAQAGSSGNWTSLLVDADQLDPSLDSFPSHYSFVADAEWNNTQLGARHAYGQDVIHGQYP